MLKNKVLKYISNSRILSIFSYCFVSIFMTIINKCVVTKYGFNLNFFMLIIQLLISLAILHVFEIFKIISLPKFTFSIVKQWLPISFLFISMIYTSSKALQFLSIPIYTIFKNLTIILTAYGEVFFMGGSVSKVTLLSFCMMILSSFMIAWEDLYSLLSRLWFRQSFLLDHSFLYYGYLWIIINCICSSAYVLETRKKIKSGHFTDFDSMFYSNLLGIPILIICTLIMDDWSSENIARNRINIIPIIAILLSGIFSAGLGYTSLWCIRVTSSTTYSMIGALNKLPVSITGLIFFHTPVTFSTISAIILGFFSGFLYVIEKSHDIYQYPFFSRTTFSYLTKRLCRYNNKISL